MTPTKTTRQRGLGSIYRRTIKTPDGPRELPVWHVQFSVNGKQYRESTGEEAYNKAQSYLKRRIAEVATGNFAGTQIDKVRLTELLDDVVADYELKDRHSLDSMARPLITRLKASLGAQRAVNVKVAQIKTYITKRKEEGASVASRNRELAMLRRAFKLGKINGKVGAAHVPEFKELMQKETNARQGFWEHAEYEAFRDVLPVDERPLFVFAYWTGCRFGEIAAITWDQVDLAGRAVRLRDTQTKAAEARIIPLGGPGADLYDMLTAQKARHASLCPASPWVFFREGMTDAKRGHGKGTRPAGSPVIVIQKTWDAAVATTGINRLFHDLRRTGVRNLIRAGVPQKVARLISGHKTDSVFDRYNIVDERDLHAAAESLGAYLGKKGEKD